jgi:hypothetical protein
MKNCTPLLRKTVTALLHLTLLMCVAVKLQANIYYISPGGSDAAGSGTFDRPWRSLYKATATVTTPGDTIYVTSGTYTETAQCMLVPGVNVMGAGTSSIIRSTLTAQFTEILNLRSEIEGTNGNQFVSGLLFDGQSRTTSWALAVYARSNVSVHNCTFINFDESAAIFFGRIDFNTSLPPTQFATGNSFYNNVVTNCAKADWLYGRGALSIAGQRGMLVYNNTLTQNTRGAGQDGYLIKVINFSEGVKIYNNTITKSPYPYAVPGSNNFWDFAVEMFDVSGCEIYNNTIQGSIDANKLTKGNYDYSLYVHNNTIGFNSLSPNPEHGILLEFWAQDVIIDSNTFKYVATVVEFDTRNASAVKNIRISRNLMHNLGVAGGTGMGVVAMITDGNFNYTINDFYIWNNTIHSDPAGPNYYGFSFSNAGSIKNLRIENNVAQNINNIIVSNTPYNIDSFYHRNNNWYNNGNGNNPLWVNGTPTNVFTTNNTNLNPGLDAAFKPLAGSPLIDAGLQTGLAYAGTAPDKGFAEYQALLPVVLTELTVSGKDGSNYLQWKTASEINSNYFVIQKSSNGKDFESIGTVAAAGNSSTLKTYSFTDYTPFSYINYYRIIIVDKDNSKEFSNIVQVKSANDKALDIVAAQVNGNNHTFNVTVASKQDQLVLLSVVDNEGRALFNERVKLTPGTNFYNRNIQHTARGIYHVRLQTAKESIAKSVFTNN